MGGAFVVGSHHLAEAFHRCGHDVTHVGAPISPVHVLLALKDPFVRARVRRWFSGGKVFDGVRDFVPFTWLPWGVARTHPGLMKAFSRCMLSSPSHPFRFSALSQTECLLVDEPRFAGLVERHLHLPIVYRATDLYASMRNDPKIIDAERLMCRHATALVATSQRVADHLQKLSGRAVNVITNGVDYDHFADAAARSAALSFNLPGEAASRAVYVGAFDHRFGLCGLRSAALDLRDRIFVLAGPGSEGVAAELGLRNVVGVGAIKYEVLPRLLQKCAVGLLPMSPDPANEARSPMKFYEYAASGLCVAATSTDELRRRQLPTLSLADSEDEFGTAVATAFEWSSDRELRRKSLETAKLESWSRKGSELLQLVNVTPPANPQFHTQPALKRANVNGNTSAGVL
jgi:glycosyltransferase involved in cell wall biosynthesis